MVMIFCSLPKKQTKKNRDGILQECKQEQGRKLTWDASPQYLFIREQRNPFILFDSLVASSLEPTPTSLSVANFRVILKIIMGLCSPPRGSL